MIPIEETPDIRIGLFYKIYLFFTPAFAYFDGLGF